MVACISVSWRKLAWAMSNLAYFVGMGDGIMVGVVGMAVGMAVGMTVGIAVGFADGICAGE